MGAGSPQLPKLPEKVVQLDETDAIRRELARRAIDDRMRRTRGRQASLLSSGSTTDRSRPQGQNRLLG